MSAARVTIGIPTHNRVTMLERAIESALVQAEDIEVLISDNASTDGTRDLCEGFVRRDARVRYFRQSENRGAIANFLTVRDMARGEYFMWLGDDDWLDPSYVQECTRVLDESPEHALVGGLARYFEAGKSGLREEDVLMALEQDSPLERVRTYFTLVGRNGLFHGLYRTRQVKRFRANAPRFGWDSSLVASMAFLGKVTTLQTVHVCRTLGGDSTGDGLNGLHGPTAYFARPENQAAWLAWEMYREIANGQDVYDSLGPLSRQKLALDAANYLILNRYGSKKYLLRTRIAPGRRARFILDRLRARA